MQVLLNWETLALETLSLSTQGHTLSHTANRILPRSSLLIKGSTCLED